MHSTTRISISSPALRPFPVLFCFVLVWFGLVEFRSRGPLRGGGGRVQAWVGIAARALRKDKSLTTQRAGCRHVPVSVEFVPD